MSVTQGGIVIFLILNIKDYIKINDLTIGTAALKFDITKRTLENILGEQRKVSLESAMKIAKTMNVKIDDLIYTRLFNE